MLTIEQIRDGIIPLCQKYNIRQAWLFGSYARGEATPESDVDIRINRKGSVINDLFSLNQFWDELEDTFQCSVDVITTIPQDEFNQIFRRNVQRDEVLLYEIG